jgi:hypothetical protein
MSVPTERMIFESRCLRVGAAARAAGATLRKAGGRAPALEIERSGKSVTVPIVTDERSWRETTVEEALYAVLVDARGWAGAKLDEATLAALVPDDESAVPLIKKDFSTEVERVKELTDVLGGDEVVQRLYAAAELA